MENFELNDASSSETYLTLITRPHAYRIIGVLLATWVVFAVASFAPKNTSIRTVSAESSPGSLVIRSREEITGFDSLSTYFFLTFKVDFKSQFKGYKPINLSIKILFLDYGNNQVSNTTSSSSYSLEYDHKPITFYSGQARGFNTVVLFLDALLETPTVKSIAITSYSVDRSISIASILSISLVTVLVSVLVYIFISKRVRPSTPEHWYSLSTIFLLILTDGPWILCQYYAIPAVGALTWLMPQVFHIFFIAYLLLFISHRVNDDLKPLFSSFIPFITVIVMICSVIMEIIFTDNNPLCAYAGMKASPYVIGCFVIAHLCALIFITIGIISLNLSKTFSHALIFIVLIVLELVNISSFFTRMFVTMDSFGVGVAFNTFYILVANSVAFLVAYLDTPIKEFSDSVTAILVQ